MENFNDSYWNDKWDKAPIIYKGRTLRSKSDAIGVDVKDFIQPKDEVLLAIISKYNLKKNTCDETALAIQQYVVSAITYKYDTETNMVPEFWQFPFETVYSKVGDCEDGAILIAALCVNAGIEEWRIKVAAGFVQPNPNAPQGGHGYCIYLADDGEWRILDWCYFPDQNVEVSKKPFAKDGGTQNSYKEVWFTFNSQYSWNQKSLVLSNRISNDTTQNTTSILESVVYDTTDLDYI